MLKERLWWSLTPVQRWACLELAGMRKNGPKFHSLIQQLPLGLIVPGTVRYEVNYSPKAFSFNFVTSPLASGIGLLNEEQNDLAPTGDQTTATTDHSDFAKCNLDAFEGFNTQAHFSRQFQVEVDVCKTYFDLAQLSNLCSWKVFVCIIRFLLLFF